MTAPGTLAIYIGAALAEIAGCFAVWAWMRQGASALWLVPGLLSLAVFAWLLTLAPSDFAGRAYAAYGGVYIAASLLWLWLIEKKEMEQHIVADAAAFSNDLKATGHVAVYGIYFDTGKSELKPESTPALEEVALDV